jgi:ComEC/Rec2-related protein
MPTASKTAAAKAVAFAMNPSQIFVISSLLAALGALLALQKVAWVFCLGAALVFFLLALGLGSGRKGAVALAMSFLIPFFMAQDRLGRLCPTDRDLSQLRASVVSFSGRVLTSKIKDTDKGRFVTVEVAAERLLLPWSKELSGKALVHIGPYDLASQILPAWGGKYLFTGRLIKPRTKVFSFEFDEQRWLALKDIYCQVSCTATAIQQAQDQVSKNQAVKTLVVTNDQGSCALKLIEEWAGLIVQKTAIVREGIVAEHTRVLGDERGKLLTSMVLGDRAVSLSESTKSAFARVGLSHLLAASGLNLTIIVGASMFLFSLTRRGRRQSGGLVQTLGALVCVLFFVSLAGASPSVTRATIMCLLLLWSSLAFRKLATGAALAGALWLALLFDPLSILDVGLELSYGATFGIIYFYTIFVDALPQALTRKPWHWLCTICAVVISAQLAVLPVQIYYFQKISTLVLPANMLAEPLVAPITVLGFVSSFIAAVAIGCSWLTTSAGANFCHLPLLVQILSQISSIIDFFCGYLIDLLIALTHFLGALPLAYLYLARPPAIVVAFYYLALAVAFIVGLNRPGRGALLAMVMGLLLTAHSFLNSSCLEMLVTKEQVVVVSPQDPPLLLLLPKSLDSGSLGDKYMDGAQGYLPTFHRDFGQSYLRSLTGRGDCLTKALYLPKATKDLLWCDSQSIVSLYLKDGGPELASSLPAAAIEIEKAQGVQLYKFKTWGLGCNLIKRLGKFYCRYWCRFDLVSK